ncbi:hypothetical protein GGX14DRAFT_664961 [Mycena pura]|uniref:Uncharacterized protein n=1 Tax=Mycena pura TaxID=153505 RepID=A0AAD6Y813_9AGAR|nr:hypothetical protein GGX14DRAFT_664961 [Mycena pura]
MSRVGRQSECGHDCRSTRNSVDTAVEALEIVLDTAYIPEAIEELLYRPVSGLMAHGGGAAIAVGTRKVRVRLGESHFCYSVTPNQIVLVRLRATRATGPVKLPPSWLFEVKISKPLSASWLFQGSGWKFGATDHPLKTEPHPSLIILPATDGEDEEIDDNLSNAPTFSHRYKNMELYTHAKIEHLLFNLGGDTFERGSGSGPRTLTPYAALKWMAFAQPGGPVEKVVKKLTIKIKPMAKPAP